MSTATDQRLVHISLPLELHDRLKERQRIEDRSMAAIFRRSVTRYLDDAERDDNEERT